MLSIRPFFIVTGSEMRYTDALPFRAAISLFDFSLASASY